MALSGYPCRVGKRRMRTFPGLVGIRTESLHCNKQEGLLLSEPDRHPGQATGARPPGL